MGPAHAKISAPIVFAVQASAALGLLALDALTPPGVADGIGYPIVLVLCLWVPRRNYLLAWASLATVLTLGAAFIGPGGGIGSASLINRAIALCSIWIVWFLIREHIGITEALRLREREALAASLAKSAFLANMSHELRTPLNAIIGFAEFINTRWPDLADSKRNEYLRDIRSSGMHLLALIGDLLDVARIEAGKYQLEEEALVVGDVISEATDMIGIAAREQGLAIATKLEPLLPRLHADRRVVKQILLNLLSNATKFTKHGGQISVLAGSSREGLWIAVSDTGIGIPRHVLSKLGQPFQQADSKMSRGKGGAGLGLALCRNFMDLHGGSLDIRSQEHKGTTVRLTFPSSRIVAEEAATAAGTGLVTAA